MENTAQATPPAVIIAVCAVLGFVATSTLMLWLERDPAILLDLSSLSAAFICL